MDTKNPNNKWIFVGIVIIIIMVLIVTIIYMPHDQNLINNTSQISNEIIQPSEKIISDAGIKYEATGSELPKNSDILFKIGEKFIYKTPEKEYGGLITTYNVEKIEEINGRECFVVIQEDNETTIETLFGKKEINNVIRHFTYYYKESGKVLKLKVENAVVKDGAEDLRATDMSFFAYWMLGLDDNAKWEINFTETTKTPSSDLVEHRKFEFRVTGREKINTMECFKVEKRVINLDKNNKVEEIDYYWIDVKKRILIKKEFYNEDKVKYFEENLVSRL